MSGFVRPRIWRLDITDRQDVTNPSRHLCVEFGSGAGAPFMTVWVETTERYKFGDKHPVESGRVSVSGRDIVERKVNRELDAYWTAEALAKDSVVGEAAGVLVFQVLWAWVIKGPKTRSTPLRKAAPDWWERVTSVTS